MFVTLHLRQPIERPGETLLCAVGMAVGSLMLVTVIGVTSSLTRAADQPADVASQTDLEIGATSDDRLAESSTDDVFDGVGAAAPLVHASVRVDGEAALLPGTDQRLRLSSERCRMPASA
jgi:hypothetical protein